MSFSTSARLVITYLEFYLCSIYSPAYLVPHYPPLALLNKVAAYLLRLCIPRSQERDWPNARRSTMTYLIPLESCVFPCQA